MVRSDARSAAAALAWGAFFFAGLLGVGECLLPPDFGNIDVVHATRRNRLLCRLRAVGDDRGREASDPQSATHGRRETALVVALGSSRSLTAFQARSIETRLKATSRHDVCVANFAIPGAGLVHGLVILGRLLRDGPAPDMLVIEVLPHSLRVADLSEVLPPKSIHLGAADRDWLRTHGLGALPEPTPSKGPACWLHRRAIVSRILPKLEPGETKWLARMDGWGSCPPVESRDVSMAQKNYGLKVARRQYAADLGCLRLPGPGAAALRAMLSECHRRRIGATVVIMPEGPEFRGWYRDAARDEIRGLLTAITDEYGSRLVDGWDWFGDDAFEDSHHLFAEGVSAFTARLDDELTAALIRHRDVLADQKGEAILRR